MSFRIHLVFLRSFNRTVIFLRIFHRMFRNIFKTFPINIIECGSFMSSYMKLLYCISTLVLTQWCYSKLTHFSNKGSESLRNMTRICRGGCDIAIFTIYRYKPRFFSFTAINRVFFQISATKRVFLTLSAINRDILNYKTRYFI